MTRSPPTDAARAWAAGANPAFRGGALAVLLLGCPQLLDDSFGPGGESGATANAGAGGSPAAGSSGAAGSSAGRGGSGGTGVGGWANGGADTSGGRGGRGGTSSSGAGGSSGSPSMAGDGGSGGTGTTTGCTFSDFSMPQPITGLGRNDALFGPSLGGNGLVLAFSESILEAPEDIYFAERSDLGAPFGVAVSAAGVNTADAEGTAFLMNDELTLYFFSDRSGGPGGRDIYRATRDDTASDFADVSLVEGVNLNGDDHMPWVSSDQRIIYFASNRLAANDDTNLWFAQRSGPQDGFEPPIELPGVNSDDRDISPSLTANRRILFFCSDRDGGPGSDDIWMATRDDLASDFGTPEPVPIVNGPASELNVTVSGDGREIIFCSNRDGIRKLYRSVRTCL